MGRSPCCKKEGLNRGAWTALEDKMLSDYIKAHGEGKWRSIPRESGLKRCGKSCRLRWLNYLRPDIKRGNITPEEEDLIIRLHKLLGNRWSLIAGRLPGRTDNEIKNYWNTTLGKKVKGEKEPKRSKERAKKPIAEVARSDVVIRTKATRCTKQVLVSSGSQPVPAGDPTAGSGPANRGSPSTASEACDSEKLVPDSDTSELLFLDMSDSERWKSCQYDGGRTEDGNVSWNGNESVDDVLLCEALMKSWGNEDDFLQYLI